MVEVEAGGTLRPNERRRLTVGGIVQGVGFRPFVWRLAGRHGLGGFIRNTGSGVLIEVEGSPEALDGFTGALSTEAPPLARVTSLETELLTPLGTDDGFLIADSAGGDSMETLISPDIALCEACRCDIADPEGRRYRNAFTNCTDCGPRYTIVESIPYDRPFTTMKGFALCPECRREYDDPADRRFHAQPNACPVCGPKLWIAGADGRPEADGDPIVSACTALRQGEILAIKGLGGFHLAVDASNDEAVRRLRERKGREEKPLAVMVRDMAVARLLCNIGELEEAALTSPQAPIVLLRRKEGARLAPSVAPGNDRLGVMLPYSPLHWLLMNEGPEVLVMTSANFSEEPLVSDNGEAVERLSGIADHFLMHDRPIARRCDDSVAVQVAGKVRMIRRSRGYVPAPIVLREDGPPVLGTGGELKNTLCLLKGSAAFLSQHIGDMKNYEAYRHFDEVATHLQRIFRTEAELLVHDLHPSYLTTRWAREQGRPLLAVQHHHAHLASCLGEHRYLGQAIGLTFDGTGYGTDGTAWGGEVLIGDAAGALRFASLEPVQLPGGDAAMRQIWRTALGWLNRSGVSPEGLPCFAQPLAPQVLELLARGTGCAESSGCGRLFDAVASISGLRHQASYEGQGAVELMQAAGGRLADAGYNFGFERRNGRWIMLVSPLVREIAAAVRAGAGAEEVARRFHRTMVTMLAEIVRLASHETGLKAVALSGGVFQNMLLAEALIHDLESNGYKVLLHEQIPTNDGGLSLGQAMIGREYLRGKYRGVEEMD